MMRRKAFSASRKDAAAHRKTIAPFFHRLTLLVRTRTPLCGDSMMSVVVRHRRKLGGSPIRYTVNISSSPSRKLAAAEGYSFSNQRACCSSRAIPWSASSLSAAFNERKHARRFFGDREGDRRPFSVDFHGPEGYFKKFEMRPLRLVAQDSRFSSLQQEFDSPRGHQNKTRTQLYIAWTFRFLC